MKRIQLAVTLQADWVGQEPKECDLLEAAKAAVRQTLSFLGQSAFMGEDHGFAHPLLERIRLDVREVSSEWVKEWWCPRCDTFAEASHDDLANSGVPICIDCGEDMERV